MKKTRLLVLGFLCCFQLASQTVPDVLQYDFTTTLSDKHDTLYGEARIRFLNKKAPTVLFDLASQQTNGKGMRVTGIFRDNISKSKLEYSHINDRLEIKLPTDNRDTQDVFIQYRGIPADGLIISKNKYGQRTFFADNWPDRGHQWLPCHDDPADKAAVGFSVIAPLHYQVVANGLQVEETNLDNNNKLTRWREDVPISTKVMVIGVADFAVELSGIINGCIPVYSWVYTKDKEKGFYDYAQAASILPYFIKMVGPYGYKKLANVQSKTTFGGLENANTIFYSETSITGTRKSETLIAHEIAHQWFGNMATEKSFAHLWLSEGFATYMTIFYMEDKYGWDTAKAMLIEDRDQVLEFSRRNNSPVVDNNTHYMQLLNANSYHKGGWVLHMLRRQLGDSVFWKSMRTYYSTFAGSIAGTDDLRMIFEKTSGKNLKKFFEQWLYTPGQPELTIGWKYDEKNKKVLFDIKQAKTNFEFPLVIGIKNKSGKTQTVSIPVNGEKTSFSVAVIEKPVSFVIDPEVSLLYSGKAAELK